MTRTRVHSEEPKMIDERLVELGPSMMPVLCVLLALMTMFALWLIYKGGLRRVACGCLLMSYPIAVTLAALGLIK
jgi:hypothetical protein